jgi:hypothetical protein
MLKSSLIYILDGGVLCFNSFFRGVYHRLLQSRQQMMLNIAALIARRGSVSLLIFTICLVLFHFVLGPHSKTTREKDANTWFIATICSASSIQRRMMIRATWQTLYRNIPMTTRFVLGKPDELWKPVLDLENKHYDDIVILDNIPDDSHTANTIKSIELFRYLLETGEHYELVSKMDDDSFLNARTFWNQYVLPLLKKESELERTIIGRRIEKDLLYPGGQFYTLTWDLLPDLVSCQDQFRITDQDEDWLVGTLLAKGGMNWSLIELENSVAFDYHEQDARNETTSAAKNFTSQNSWSHAVGPQAINPHKMKDDETYLKVAACFDNDGVILSCFQ